MSGLTATTVTTDSLVGSTSANAITVRGEGSATTSLQQGLAKSWCYFNGTGTLAINDSFNVGSVTDNATGRYTVNYTNNFASDNYCALGTANNFTFFINNAPTSSTFNHGTRNSSNTDVDSSTVCTAAKGDLA